MSDNHLWHILRLIVQYAPGMIDLIALIVTLVLLLAVFIRDRR